MSRFHGETGFSFPQRVPDVLRYYEFISALLAPWCFPASINQLETPVTSDTRFAYSRLTFMSGLIPPRLVICDDSRPLDRSNTLRFSVLRFLLRLSFFSLLDNLAMIRSKEIVGCVMLLFDGLQSICARAWCSSDIGCARHREVKSAVKRSLVKFDSCQAARSSTS